MQSNSNGWSRPSPVRGPVVNPVPPTPPPPVNPASPGSNTR